VELNTSTLVSRSSFELTHLQSKYIYTCIYIYRYRYINPHTPCSPSNSRTPCIWFLQLAFNTRPVTSAWPPTWRRAAAGATLSNGRTQFWPPREGERERERSFSHFCSGFQMLRRYRPAQTRVVGLQLPRRGEIDFPPAPRFMQQRASGSFFLESFLWSFTQAKGTCEDYNPFLSEGTRTPYNQSSPGPTSASVTEDHTVTKGKLLRVKVHLKPPAGRNGRK